MTFDRLMALETSTAFDGTHDRDDSVLGGFQVDFKLDKRRFSMWFRNASPTRCEFTADFNGVEIHGNVSRKEAMYADDGGGWCTWTIDSIDLDNSVTDLVAALNVMLLVKQKTD